MIRDFLGKDRPTDYPRPVQHLSTGLPPPPPEPVPGCAQCARLARETTARAPRTELIDARVLLQRHLTEDHQPPAGEGCEQ